MRRLNHIKEALKDKNGDAYIWLCVIVVFISMLLSVLILYMGLLSQVQIQKRDVKTKLDSVVSEYATEMFGAIKQGAPSERYIDYDGLVPQDLCEARISKRYGYRIRLPERQLRDDASADYSPQR